MVSRPKYLLLFLLSGLVLTACTQATTDGSGSNFQKLYGDVGTESSYCGSALSTPMTATTVTATATYQARQVVAGAGLGASATSNIRYAQVQILNASGTVIQCGETDSSGGISLDITQAAGTYTLKVLSRADNTHYKASVLNNPTGMLPYSITASFTLAGNETSKAVTLSPASYLGTLEGGAFNILDQILDANEFIASNNSIGFTVASKVRVFWTPGLSPGAYYGEPTAAISFFLPDDDANYGMGSGMYIMGGVNGSTCTDTDHFDNSILIHEYGHFLEKAYSYSDSPGGSHGGNSLIDPRLAWSEGWANFVQGAVRGDHHYYDTIGNISCSGGTAISVNMNLEHNSSGALDYMATGTFLGEGIFREVSVARSLWDTMTNLPIVANDSEGADVGFSFIWKIFADATSGFRNTSVHFRNIGKFNELMRAEVNTNANAKLASFDSLLANEFQRADTREYGKPVTPTAVGSCGAFSPALILAKDISGNNLAKTNDFFQYYYDGTVAHALVTLKYTGAHPASDLDMYIWKDGYAFTSTSTLAGQSARFYPESGSSNGSGNETVNLGGLAAGYYMIQVMADPDSTGTNNSTYHLETNSGTEYLCP